MDPRPGQWTARRGSRAPLSPPAGVHHRRQELPVSAGDAEADLIAWEDDNLVIVEVKSRATAEHGPPERAIGEDKRRHLLRVAREYARKTDTPWEKVRFDVVTVILSTPPQILLFRALRLE